MEIAERKTITYGALILLVNYIPTIGFHLAVRPMWYKSVNDYTDATLTEMVFTVLILPIYLVVANYLLAKKFNKLTELFILNALIILSCIFISTHLHFKNRADSIGSFSDPDHETKGVMDFERIAGLSVSAIGLGIVFFRIHQKNKMANNSDLHD